ncbi:hypothetical protein [Microbulbifer hainanensis]|uniref:hypothetical protein n=1 Tax=Microbulbifer hainanensis TaxID=2735675 RepID=UPI00186787DE|nr:hypothetical protein [Microbulbifer hainanensis]
MKRNIFKRAIPFALIPVAVGLGRLTAAHFGGENTENLAFIAKLTLTSMTVVFGVTCVFLFWWTSEKRNLGKSRQLPLLQSPLFWIPAMAAILLGITHALKM